MKRFNLYKVFTESHLFGIYSRQQSLKYETNEHEFLPVTG